MQRDEVIYQIANATTLPEIAGARHLWREWTEGHPDDEAAADLFSLLNCAEDVARERLREWAALQAKWESQGAACLTRDEIARVGLSASGLQEVAEARRALHEWERAHPDEPKMYEVFEQLYMMEDAARGEAEEEQAVRPKVARSKVPA